MQSVKSGFERRQETNLARKKYLFAAKDTIENENKEHMVKEQRQKKCVTYMQPETASASHNLLK